MNTKYDDPKYTAYVLGELDNAERTAVEEKLRASSEAMTMVAEIRATTERLSRALQSEPAPQLAMEQRATLLTTANENGEVVATSTAVVPAASRPRRLSMQGRIVAIGSLAIAVCLMLALALPATQSAREAAMRPTPNDSWNNLKQMGAAVENHHSTRLPSPYYSADDSGSMPTAGSQPSNPAFREGYERMGESGITSDAPIAYPDQKSWDELKQRRAKYEEAGTSEPLQMQVTPRIGFQTYEKEHLGDGQVPSKLAVQQENKEHLVRGPAGGKDKADVATPRHHPQQGDQKQQGQQPSDQFGVSLSSETRANHDRRVGQAGQEWQSGLQTLSRPLAERERVAELRPQLARNEQLQFGELSGQFLSEHNTEAYDYVTDNPFLGVNENPLSTFSIDVDTASYSNVRRFLMQQNQRPPRGAVRIEELVNYFRYDYPQPEGDKPFSVTTEVASCPWEPEHRLVRIGLKGRELPEGKRPPSNLVFLLDVSGSMQPANKLPLVKQSLKMLTEQLGENDKVSIVVYAGSSGLVLPSTRGDSREAILDAIDRLSAGGSTNGTQGIELAYEIATNNLQKGGVNRVILATDGDFNVGVTNQDDLVRLIEEKAKTGVFLTTLGFGMGNVKDSTLEKLADKGNGNYAYIDDLPEARKVLVEEIGSTLVTIAKDVKIQVEFNPAEVAAYRLIGYENRILAKEDFNDDKKDAGEIGAGHTVTALYEVVPVATAEGRKQKAEGAEQAAGGGRQAEGKESEVRNQGKDSELADELEMKRYELLVAQLRKLQSDAHRIQQTLQTLLAGVESSESFPKTDGQKAESLTELNEALAKKQSRIEELERQIGPMRSKIEELTKKGKDAKAEAQAENSTVVDSLRYQEPASLSEAARTGELFTLKLRYKQPDGDKSTLIETPVKDAGKKYREASPDFKFAAAVASFGMILRDSPFKGNATMSAVEELAGEGVVKEGKQQTDASYRAEFVEMVKKAKALIGP